VTRLTVLGLATVLLLGGAAVALARVFGKSGSRPAVLVSVVAHWLGAWVVWSFAGGLALRYGVLGTYEGAWFAAVALAGAAAHYRVQARGGREQGLAVFVGAQLLWLVVVLVQNGLLGS
jgi:hypothetical protein